MLASFMSTCLVCGASCLIQLCLDAAVKVFYRCDQQSVKLFSNNFNCFQVKPITLCKGGGPIAESLKKKN